jgi:hypothetical protein
MVGKVCEEQEITGIIGTGLTVLSLSSIKKEKT